MATSAPTITLPTPETKNAPQDAVTVDSLDGAFVMWSRRSLRAACADAINDARRTNVLK